MSGRSKAKRAGRAAPARQDGLETRRALLEAAGEAFAQHGYAKATSKEICERAKANIAAVNYHFGSKDGLYAAVLQEAHARIVSIESMAATASSKVDAKLKLRMFLSRIVRQVANGGRTGWELRVLSREILSPSPMMSGLIEKQIAPKAGFLRGILAEVMKLPHDHPAVSRSLINIMGPILMLLVTDRTIQRKVAPQLNLDADAMTEHLVAYALGGLEAVARRAHR